MTAAKQSADETTNQRLEAVDLTKVYRGRRVVNGVSLHVCHGEVVGLLGPNGAGKTTTFYMMVGLVRPVSGSVLLHGRNVTRAPMHIRARRGVGYLAQEPSIFRKMTVEQNILAILELVGVPRKARAERTQELLEQLDLVDNRKQRGYTLSGGERRRAEIARALASSPSFILLDEPFTCIDPIAVQDIQSIIANLKTRGIGILITDHSVRETLEITDRAYIMHDGVIKTSGTSTDLPTDPIAKEFYLGDRFQY